MATDPKKQAELRKKVEFQVACEEKAFRIVERLIDNPVCPQFFQDALHFITPSHYSDIVEERAVSKLCGYPLCPKSLDKVLKQKYMISTKTNKVYDIEERKNFCSARCYQASQHVAQQILSSPVWSRNTQPPKKYTFLALDTNKGKVGEEVFLSMADELREEIKTLDKIDTYHDQLEERKAKTASQTDNVKQSKDISNETEVYTLDRALQEMNLDDSVDNVTNRNDHENVCDKSDKSSANDQSNVSNEEKSVKKDVTKERRESDNSQGTKLEMKHQEKVPKISHKSKHSKAKSKGSNPQTDYLMKLLDKRKALLSKMADIQTNPVASPEQSSGSDHSENRLEEETVTGIPGSEIKLKETKRTSLHLESNAKPIIISNANNDSNKNQNSNVEAIREIQIETDTLQNKSDKDQNGVLKADLVDSVESKSKESELIFESSTSMGSLSPLESILEVIRTWITKETVEYLSAGKEACSDAEGVKDEFERQYKELVKKVDAQERDFDELIGEELMEKQEMATKAPVPDFDQLKKEAEENYQKVNAFLGGKLTYKVKETVIVEKDTNETQEIVLPTVDRYNQMLIRQKIVLDRISKVLPELLSPLRLFVQDVFTEMRELVSTFNLTSENVLFKPEEWLLVTLVLLKLLCRQINRLQQAFTTTSSRTHFTVLLKALNFDMETLDSRIRTLLLKR